MLMVSLIVLNSNAATDATSLFLDDIMGIDIAKQERIEVGHVNGVTRSTK